MTSNISDPLVSVIIPCFNQGKYLYDCLDCLNLSTIKNIEIIIINDGSSDSETLEILNNITSIYATLNITIHNQTNRGLSAARNKGINLANGAFIQLLDSDDLIAKNKFELQLNIFNLYPSVQVVISDYQIAPDNLSENKKLLPSTIDNFTFTPKTFITQWEKGLSIPIHCALFKKETVKKVAFLQDFKAKEDWIFWTTLSHQIGPESFHYHKDYLAIYRSNPTSMTRFPDKMLLEWVKAQTFLFAQFSFLFTPQELQTELEKNSKHIIDLYLKPMMQKENFVKKALKNYLRKHPKLRKKIYGVRDFAYKVF